MLSVCILDRIPRPLFSSSTRCRNLGVKNNGGHMLRTRQVVHTLTILVLTLSAFAQENASSGRWTATLTKGNKTGIATLNINTSGTSVTGTLSDPSRHSAGNATGQN